MTIQLSILAQPVLEIPRLCSSHAVLGFNTPHVGESLRDSPGAWWSIPIKYKTRSRVSPRRGYVVSLANGLIDLITTRSVSEGFRAEGPAHPLPVPLGAGLADQ